MKLIVPVDKLASITKVGTGLNIVTLRRFKQSVRNDATGSTCLKQFGVQQMCWEDTVRL